MSEVKPKTTMQISVQNAKGEHTYFKVKSSTTLGKVMDAYAKKLNLGLSWKICKICQERVQKE